MRISDWSSDVCSSDLLILTPNASEIDDWQASLLHPCAADRVYPPLILVDFVGAAIGADQDISALFLPMCADEGEPDVFADRQAQLCAADFNRGGKRTRRMVALCVTARTSGAQGTRGSGRENLG